MLKKTLLCGALVITALNAIVVSADKQAIVAPNFASDSSIDKKVTHLFNKSLALKGAPIAIKTSHNIVSLKGKVDTDNQYEQAVYLANSVHGVTEVNADDLLVKESKSPLADTFLTAKVKGIILKESLFGDKDVEYWPISIETKDGVVHIMGKVSNEKQASNLQQLIKSVKGVKAVESALTIDNNKTEA